MKKILISFISFFSFTVFSVEVTDISAQQLLEAKTQDWLIIDVRTEKEYNQGHVPGAINIAHDQIAANMSKLLARKDTPVVLYCRSGFRAGKAADVLLEHDFTQVKHLEGDMLGWQEAGLEIEK